MSLALRLKLVREALGMSKQKLSQELGLSPSTWTVYESGASQPGTKAVEALGNLGINLNWLICGLGPMWRREEESLPEKTLQGHLEQSDRIVADSLKLGTLLIHANSSHLPNRIKLLDVLTRNESISFFELVTAAGVEEDVAAATLQELMAEGKVTLNTENGRECFRINGSVLFRMTSSNDYDSLALSTIRAIVAIAPQASRNTKEAVLLGATVSVQRDQKSASIERLLSAVNEIYAEPHSDECESLELVLAVGKKEL